MRNTIMKKRIASLAAAAVVSASCTLSASAVPFTAVLPSAQFTASAAENSVKFISANGYAEGAYVMWSSVSGAGGYNVYADGVQLDSMLIRQYSGYMRADAVGLTSGSHTLKVVPVIGGSEDASKSAEITVTSYANDRSGFAFVSGSSNGAYNSDGTLKSDALVVYVTNSNKDSVSAKIDATGKGAENVTGFQNIITAYKKGKEPRSLNIRIIGNITDPSVLTKGDIVVDTVTAGLTIEGIGNDATLNGFGLVLKNCSNVEIRNLGFMNCNSSEGDNCGLQQNNNHIWVHNCDFFYGDAGSDADQAKGDGALDTKTSTFITHSYNHFWDSGKCNLQGMKSETAENYITYHHNWYDHSDSRHPRIRTCSVHCYNNYFDGNSKYGIGVTMGASCFAENNYFRNCKYPMLISEQGSDVATGGTFSGESGGIIKSFGNIITGGKAFVPYSENNSDFDAYDASSADEKIGSGIKAKSGSAVYNNFDTSSIMYSYTPDNADDVPAIVSAKAGRVDGGDFKWTFDNSVDDESYDVNSALKSALSSYKSSVQSIGSGFKEDSSTAPVITTKPSPAAVTTTAKPSSPTPTQTSIAPVQPVSGGYNHNFTSDGTSSSFYSITGNLSSSKGSAEYNGQTLTQCLKLESSTSVSFTAPSSGKLTLVFGDAGSTVKLDGNKLTADSNGILTTDITAGSHTLTKADTANLFYVSLSGSGTSQNVTTSPAKTTSPAVVSEPSKTTSPQSTEVTPGDIKVVSAGGWNEMMYLVLSGLKDSDVSAVSFSGPTSGSLTGEDFEYLVRDTEKGLRVDILGIEAGSYSISLTTSKGTVKKDGITVSAQDRSGYAHFNYSDGVGAYTDGGTIKANAKILYITDSNKDTVTVTSKDGTTVKGIGNILNSVGQDIGGGKTANGGTKPNSNSGIIKKLAEDGTPLIVRIIGNVKAPSGLTAYDSTDFGGSVGDNGFMARMKSGKDITIEGVGSDAVIDGWGFHFMCESAAPTFGKSFEVRNIAFRNVPEDCIGMEGVQEKSSLSAPVERCWIHNCEFYVPKISNPAESDKAEGDGACDFKRGQYFTNSYCYYEGYHKTNLVGASDDNMQYHLTYHHNYWKNCESRGPLARQANIHMYNNIFENQSSYCMNPRANAYIFSEYNVFTNCKNPMEIKSGAIKSFNDVMTGCKGSMDGTSVSSKTQKVSSQNKYANFDTDSSLCYIPSESYLLHTDTAKLASVFESDGGCMDDNSTASGEISVTPSSPAPVSTTTATAPVKPYLAGDANNDGTVDLSDAVTIMQSLANPSRYQIPNPDNADVYQKGSGITNMDALTIQKYLLKLIATLPEN